MSLKVGIIGGSGLEDSDIVVGDADVVVDTPYGAPSSLIKIGKIMDVDVVLLARHGREHTVPPTQVNFRANIFALKKLGCTHILATTAVGSLREEIKRGDLVVLDQFIDFTRHRFSTFYEKFEPHSPKHTAMSEPFSIELRTIITSECEKLNLAHHPKGTVITIEGPRFSTKAESKMFRVWGADVINMSVAPEVALANEIGVPYAAVAMSTDYDCWKEGEEPVSWEVVAKIFNKNANNVRNLLVAVVKSLKIKYAGRD